MAITKKTAEIKDEKAKIAELKEESFLKKSANFAKKLVTLVVTELLVLVVIAFALAFVFKTFVVQPFKVEMVSMTPTVLPNDRVLVNKFIYRFSRPKRGDVITVYSPEAEINTGFHIANLWSSSRKILIKRIIATEGEKIEIKNGTVFINNKSIKENYVKFKDFSSMNAQTIPKGYVFVMGDNRPNSKDSRIFGVLKRSEIIGKTFCIYWPPSELRWL